MSKKKEDMTSRNEAEIREPQSRGPRKGPRILVIRLRSIGDMLLITPALSMLRQASPDAEITVVSEALSERMVKLHPAVDRVITLDRRAMKAFGSLGSFFGDLAFLKWLRSLRFDMAVDLYGGPRSAFMAYVSGAPSRIGFDKPNRRAFYTHPFPEAAGVHTVEINLALVAGIIEAGLLGSKSKNLGGHRENEAPADRAGPIEPASSTSLEKTYALVFPVTQAESARARSLLSPLDGPYASVHLGARFPTKSWPLERFGSVLSRLYREYGISPVMVGGPEDAQASEKLMESLEPQGIPSISLAGAAGLGELAAVASGGVFFLGNDSGPMHIASAAGCPVVALFGPSDPVRWRPWGTRHRVVTADLDCSPCPQVSCATGRGCMAAIKEREVWEAIEGILPPSMRKGTIS